MFHPAEPSWLKRLREQYSARRRAMERLETRIAMSDSGMEFVARVKRAGRRS